MQQCSTPRGGLAILALDHRHNLREALNPSDPAAVSAEEMITFKQDVTRLVSPAATAVLLDPEYGIGNAIVQRNIPGGVGLLAALEETGFIGESTARSGHMVENWSVEKACLAGANAVKLLVYYHPASRTAAEMEALVQQTAEECQKLAMPFFVEALTYSILAADAKLTSKERRKAVIESAARLTATGADVFKAEFPLDISVEKDEKAWYEACAELTQASQVPWVLLSASVPFEVYLHQLTVACEAGASGAAVGRAVWAEAVHMQNRRRQDFLGGSAHVRMQRVTAVCAALARPWSDVLAPQKVKMDWYTSA